jgi:hypothetical protein
MRTCPTWTQIDLRFFFTNRRQTHLIDENKLTDIAVRARRKRLTIRGRNQKAMNGLGLYDATAALVGGRTCTRFFRSSAKLAAQPTKKIQA